MFFPPVSLPKAASPFDVLALARFVAATEQDNHRLAIQPEVDAISRPEVNTQFIQAAIKGFGISHTPGPDRGKAG